MGCEVCASASSRGRGRKNGGAHDRAAQQPFCYASSVLSFEAIIHSLCASRYGTSSVTALIRRPLRLSCASRTVANGCGVSNFQGSPRTLSPPITLFSANHENNQFFFCDLLGHTLERRTATQRLHP